MTSNDFVRIFYSNFSPNIDWANIDEIAWMYGKNLFKMSSKILTDYEQFEKHLNSLINSTTEKLKEGESLTHLVLKLFAKDYLIKYLKINKDDISFEYPLIGFKVDVIDKKLQFPIECGDTNALKLEKYLFLPTTDKFFVLPYPHFKDLEIFEFSAYPRFFDYIKHKQNFLNKKNSKLR